MQSLPKFNILFLLILSVLLLTFTACEDSKQIEPDADEIKALTADFSYNIDFSSREVTFYNLSTPYPANNPITKYDWQFGDGDNSSLKDPKHIYNDSKFFTVTLTVMDDNKTEAAITRDIFPTLDMIALGYRNSFIIDNKSNTVYAFGKNGYGELGLGHNDKTSRPTPVNNSNLLAVKSVAIGLDHAVVFNDNSFIYSTGRANFGQRGDNVTLDNVTPDNITIDGMKPDNYTCNFAQLENLTPMNKLKASAAGDNHTLMLDDKGKIYGWGANNFGQVGDGRKNSVPSLHDNITYITSYPTEISRDKITEDVVFIKIAAGKSHSVAIDNNGKIYTWGSNERRQLGVSVDKKLDNYTALKPELADNGSIPQGMKVVNIAASTDGTLALTADGKVYAWGDRVIEQNTKTPTPIRIKQGAVPKNRKIIQIAKGDTYSLILDDNFTLYAFGLNNDGILADDTLVDEKPRYEPTAIKRGDIPENAKIILIAAGPKHAIVLCDNGKFYSWGNNRNGELGIDKADEKRILPTEVIIK